MTNRLVESPTHAGLSLVCGASPDFFIVADGSGTLAHTPCGYFCWLVPREGAAEPLWGSRSRGSNNFAELSAVLLGLERVAEGEGGGRGRLVVCLSDSEVTVRCAKREYARRVNLGLWGQLDRLENDLGIKTDWRWVRRNSLPSHAQADGESRAARVAMEAVVAGGG